MPCPASAGAAEKANGAVERMVLLGLTARIIAYFRRANCRGTCHFAFFSIKHIQ